MFPQLHRAFTVDRSLCFLLVLLFFKIYPDINSMVSLNDERRGRFFSDAPPFQVQITFRALALRQSDWRNCGLCVGLLVGTW